MENLSICNNNLEDVKINSNGKLTIINIFAIWCEHCRKELKNIEKIYNMYEGKITLYVVCSIKNKDEIEEARKYFRQNKFSFPIYFDIHNILIKNYNVAAFPTTVILDKTLNTLSKIVGEGDIDKLINTIEDYIIKC